MEQRAHGRAHLYYAGLVPAAIVVAGLYFGKPVLLPLAVAIVLAFALAPLVAALRRLHLGRTFSVLAAAILSIAIVISGAVFVSQQIIGLADELPSHQNNIISKIQNLRGATVERGAMEKFTALLNNLRQEAAGAAPAVSSPATVNGAPASPPPLPVEVHQPEPAPLQLLIAVIKPLIEPLLMAAVVFVFVIFILLSKEDLRDRFIRLAGAGDMQRTTLLLDEGAIALSRYLLTQTAINASFGILIAVGVWLIGLPTPMLWGFCVFILRFVPYIGVPLGAIPPLVLALSVAPGWSPALETAALFLFGEAIVGQAIEPWLYGKYTGLSPVAIVVSATFWTALWGPVGLLLSNPFTMCLVLLGRHVEHLRFLDVLLGDKPPLGVDEALYLRMLGDDPDEAAAEAESFIEENSLSRYYSEVALKALALADGDINRGALDSERAAKIPDTTRNLIQNLSQSSRTGSTEEAETPPPISSDDDPIVFCIGGRGPADEATALLLIHLLEQTGTRAELIAAHELRAPERFDFSHARVVCICYLNPGNADRAAYLLRRVRRVAPRAAHLAAFWGATNAAEISRNLGCQTVVSLDDAVTAINAASGQAPHPVAAASSGYSRGLPVTA